MEKVVDIDKELEDFYNGYNQYNTTIYIKHNKYSDSVINTILSNTDRRKYRNIDVIECDGKWMVKSNDNGCKQLIQLINDEKLKQHKGETKCSICRVYKCSKTDFIPNKSYRRGNNGICRSCLNEKGKQQYRKSKQQSQS